MAVPVPLAAHAAPAKAEGQQVSRAASSNPGEAPGNPAKSVPAGPSGREIPHWHRIRAYDRDTLLEKIKSMWSQLDERDTQLQYVWDVYHRDVFKAGVLPFLCPPPPT